MVHLCNMFFTANVVLALLRGREISLAVDYNKVMGIYYRHDGFDRHYLSVLLTHMHWSNRNHQVEI